MDHILIVNRLFAGLLHPPFASVMKSTKVQTLGELRMRGTANWWAGLLICIHSWSPAKSLRRVCTWASYTIRKHAGVDTHPSLWLLVPSRYTEQVEVYKPVLISILACSLGFHYITSECRICIKIAFLKNQASVQLNPLLLLFSRFLACGDRKCRNRRTDRDILTNQGQ